MTHEHRAAESPLPPSPWLSPGAQVGGAISFEYDDGNGMWITFPESPFDLGFNWKYYPQE